MSGTSNHRSHGVPTFLEAIALCMAWLLFVSILPQHVTHEIRHGVSSIVLVKGRTHEFKMLRAVTFAAIGDSISARPEQGSLYPWQSWTFGAESARTVYVPGGYAVPGRTTVDMLAATIPLDIDVLVFQGAVNDVNHLDNDPAYAHDAILDRIAAIVTIVGAPHSIVAALPPNDRYPAEALTFNAELRAFTLTHGWAFVDPWAAFRNADGTYVAGAAWDDLHPTEATALTAGHTLGGDIWAVANQQKVFAV